MAMVTLIEEARGAWVRLVMNEPRGNLLSLAMVRALQDALAGVETRGGLKWLTIEGAGSEFSYGAKIQEHLPTEMRIVLPAAHGLLRQLLTFPAPTAALVQGRCLGGGFELALACDDIIAASDASFGLPEIALAAFPPAGAALLPLKVGASRASRAIVTGATQAAAYWHDAGLMSLVAPEKSLHDVAAEWFERHLRPRSAAALSHAVRASRLTLLAQALPALDTAERLYLESLLSTDDAREGIQAFIDKRRPTWKDA